ncbi:MAG: hypothetical protein DME50_17840 [Verrucomicrobia bacterium]|nr:MAG: hypothetical protein DME50_17840 [Verrucomicrobiota bacterium]
MESSEWSVLGSRDIDGQPERARERERKSQWDERDGRHSREGSGRDERERARYNLIAKKGLPS